MSKQTQGTMLMVGALSGMVAVVSFVALMVLGGYAFSPAAFLAILVAIVVAVFLLIAFHRKPTEPSMQRQAHAPMPKADVPHAPAPAPGPGNLASPAPNAGPAPANPVTERPSATHSPVHASHTAEAEKPASASQHEGGHDEDNIGSRPHALDAPRDGGADDLKKIKGVGPKLEELCNSLGFYHFDQIAHWTADEVAWVDNNLEGFKGRVTRDDWVAQASVLASGGDTEFSKKVDDGSVY